MILSSPTTLLNKQLLVCGGLVGHLMHLYDNRDLTFGEIKKILRRAATGRLEKVSEKMDGMNLVFSYDISSEEIRVTRGSDVSKGGMDATALAAKFAGRGSVEEAFTNAFKVLQGAVGSLPKKVKEKIFGPSVDRWYSIEVIYTKNPNVINYDSNNIVFHGWPVFKRTNTGSVEMSEDEVDGVDTLAQYIDRMQASISQTGWRVKGPSLIRMNNLSNGTIFTTTAAKIDEAAASAGVGDSDTIGDYLRLLIRADVDALGLPPKVANMLMARVFEESDAPTVVDIKKAADKSLHKTISDFVKGAGALFKQYVMPIEIAINDFAVELLKGLNSTLIDDSDREVSRLRSEVQTAINAIEASGNEGAMSILKQQMEKLKDVSNITSPMEGVVFIYKGNAYKFTGSFAAANQILGLFKYGRKGIKI